MLEDTGVAKQVLYDALRGDSDVPGGSKNDSAL